MNSGAVSATIHLYFRRGSFTLQPLPVVHPTGFFIDPKFVPFLGFSGGRSHVVVHQRRGKAAIFSHSGDSVHKGAISEKRLSLVDQQVRALLGPTENGGYGCGDLVEMIATPMKAGASTRRAYTAVASRYVPGNDEHFDHSGIDVHFEYSLNVLEPLMNVFISHNVLPSIKEEYCIAKA